MPCMTRAEIDAAVADAYACVFKTMTAEGTVSMCLHNAKRDSFILQPLGEAPQRYGLKHAKGRARQNLVKQRALA